jgi:predicted N-acetyltransferase YhbS
MDGAHAGSHLIIRSLHASDLPRLVAMDRDYTGRARRAWFQGKLQRALDEADLKISLGAVMDGLLVGAILGALAYGEFGQPEPVAVLDTVLVDRAFEKQGIGRALVDQLVRNLHALHIESVRTEVGWTEHTLLGFLGHAGFAPVPRLVLELDVAKAAATLGREETEAAARLRFP